MCQEAHAFRGEYLNLCAHVEAWAVGILLSDAVQKSDTVKTKLPYLFGAKLKAVASLAENHPSLLSNSKRVVELMSEFEPFARLRSDLAHAVMTVHEDEEFHTMIFDNPGVARLPKHDGRFWVNRDEAKKLVVDLKNLVKRINDQRLKA